MFKFHQNYPLHDLNTFHVPAYAKYFCEINSHEDIAGLFNNDIYKNQNRLILGGGSNILFTTNFNGLVIKNNIKGLKIISGDNDNTVIEAASGELWHEFVKYTVNLKLGGLENLAYIPGTVGAAPVQNIGAYGVELKDSFISLTAFDLSDGHIKTFSKDECGFGYRNSVFKNEFKDRFYILSATFLLSRHFTAKKYYRDISEELARKKIVEPDLQTVFELIIQIRKNKLPEPDELGNAGSFFKNPSVDAEKYNYLQKLNPGITGYFNNNGTVKIPAAWLVDQCGWKGKRSGNTGIYHKQALIVVNYGNATGSGIFDFVKQIQKSVREKFEINLEFEVNII